MYLQGEDDSWCATTRKGEVKRRGCVGKTEVEVIRDWFINIFMPVEKTADIEVTDFKFEQLNHLRAQYHKSQSSRGQSAAHRLPPDPGVESDGSLDANNANGNSPFTVLKKADVELLVGGKKKMYSVVIKVLPTDDCERHTSRRKFSDLLKFSKEVQVYCQALRCMVSYDEKRYSSACIEPPVPKCYLGQLDAQNDVLVLEDLGQSGYRKFCGNLASNTRYLSDMDHCRVVLRRLAHFHAFSTLIQRDADETLLDLFPFAVDASVFREQFQSRVAIVKAELVRYLVCNKGMVSGDADEAADKVERQLQDLFWKLVELRAQPHNMRMCVLAHGSLDLRNIVFQYDETSGRPISAKFLDFSTMTVSSPIIDISYFLHSSVLPEVAAHHHSSLLTVYHRAHLEAIKSFGMHGFEMELDDLLTEYHAKQDYGAMMACLLKPALYVLQCIGGNNNQDHTNGGASTSSPKNGTKNGTGFNGSLTDAENNEDTATEDDHNGDATTNAEMSQTAASTSLKIDKNLVPVDLRLHGYLSNLAKACPCPCAVGSRELTIAELSADSLEDLHIVAKQQIEDHKLKAFDCNGATRSTLKKLFKGLITNNSNQTSIEQKSGGGNSKSNQSTSSTSNMPNAPPKEEPAASSETKSKSKS